MAVIEHQAGVKLTPNGYPAILSLMPVIAGLGYVAAYPLLDWLSYVEPFEGTRYNAMESSSRTELSPGPPVWPPDDPVSVDRAVGFPPTFEPFTGRPGRRDRALSRYRGRYSAAALFLLRPATHFDPALPSTRDLILLMLTALAARRLLPWDTWHDDAVRLSRIAGFHRGDAELLGGRPDRRHGRHSFCARGRVAKPSVQMSSKWSCNLPRLPVRWC